MLALALALTLAVGPAPEPALRLADGGEDYDEAEEPYGEEEPGRLELTAWGGQLLGDRGGGTTSEAYAAELTWRFDRLDLGLVGAAYALRDPALDTRFAPVFLARIGQRFETRNGLLATFNFGLGAARSSSWRSWFQVAIGARATFGPAFVAGELAFESEDLLRLAVGLGVAVF